MKTIPLVSADRNCGDCTLCCEGWLVNSAHGFDMWPGRKCQFVAIGDGCTIYDHRPETCQKYQCQWLTDKRIPEWMKPNKIGTILKERELDGIKYLEVTEAGKKLDSEVLTWVFNSMVNKTFENIKYQVSGGWNYFGTKEFFEMFGKYFSR
jgi:hypothetical protein